MGKTKKTVQPDIELQKIIQQKTDENEVLKNILSLLENDNSALNNSKEILNKNKK